MKKFFDALQDQMIADMKKSQSPRQKAIAAGITVPAAALMVWFIFTMVKKEEAQSRDAAEIHAQLSAMEAEVTVRMKVGDAVGAIELLGKLSHPSQEVFRRIEGDGVFEDSRTVTYQEFWDGRRDSLLKVVTEL